MATDPHDHGTSYLLRTRQAGAGWRYELMIQYHRNRWSGPHGDGLDYPTSEDAFRAGVDAVNAVSTSAGDAIDPEVDGQPSRLRSARLAAEAKLTPE